MNAAKTRRIQVADLALDTGQRRLWRGGDEIELPKRSFDLLVALVEAAPDCLSTDELIDKVWHGAVVSTTTVAKRVELLRNALGDSSDNPRYVALVRGHGYRLVPELSSSAVHKVPGPRRWMVIASAAIIAAVVVAWFGLQPERPAPEKSIAVLPFVSLSGEAEDERFADGLTEELIHALTGSNDIRVAGRTSSFFYKERQQDLREIGAALGVSNLLEGSVRREGESLRVTAQLVDASDGFQLWSEVYDRPMASALQIQQDIARSVSTRLQSSISAARLTNRTRTATNPEAYALYLRAVSLSPYPFGIDLAVAQDLLEQVVEMDPGFALAWARLATVHGRRIVARDATYDLSAQEGLAVVYHALDRAREIDPELGEIYATLGGLAWAIENDRVKAASLIEKALELDPWNLSFMTFAANFATYLGRYEEALALEEILIERDPLCVSCRYQIAQSYEYTRRFDGMERELLTLTSLGQRRLEWELARANLYQRQPEEALRYLEQSEDPTGQAQIGRAMALHDMEDRQEALALLGDAAEHHGDELALRLAQGYAYVGDIDSAIAWLRTAVSNDPRSLYFQFPSPLFDNLRDDPRWHELLSMLGLAPEQLAAVPFTLQTVLNRQSD